MIKLLLTLLSLLIIGTFAIKTNNVPSITTTTSSNYIYTVIGDYSDTHSILIVNPFATNGNYVVYNVTLEFYNSILDILSFDPIEKTILVYADEGAYQSLLLIDYTTGLFKQTYIAYNEFSFSYSPQKLVYINNVVYMPVKDTSNDNQHVQILEVDFNDHSTRYVQLNSPSFTTYADQNLIQGYDPINNKLYIGYGTSYNGVNLIEVTLNLNFNASSGDDSGSAAPATNEILYDNIQGFTRFEYIFTDNSGQVYIVSRDPQMNIIVCKFDKDSKECPTFYNYGQDLNNFEFQAFFLSQDRSTFTLMGPPTADNTQSLQLVQFQVNNNMKYSLSSQFPNYWNNTNSISEIAISM